MWPERAQNLLTDLMHRYGVYAYNQTSIDSFELIFHELYQIVDHSDWYPPVHDDLLRERTRRKMAQIRGKMVKSGEIVSRADGYGGWTRSESGAPDMPHAGADPSLHSLSGMHLNIDMHTGADRDVDSTSAIMGGPSTYLQPQSQHEQDLLQQQDLSHAHAQALMEQSDLQRGDYTQQGLARQHELLAQQGIAQEEQMARRHNLEQDLSQEMSQAMIDHNEELVV